MNELLLIAPWIPYSEKVIDLVKNFNSNIEVIDISVKTEFIEKYNIVTLPSLIKIENDDYTIFQGFFSYEELELFFKK